MHETSQGLLDGPIDAASFRTYVEKVLVPTLKPGDIVILDNLGSHKGKAIRQRIRSAGAKLFFLPKYSSDLNPIEQVFAKLKHQTGGKTYFAQSVCRFWSARDGAETAERGTVADLWVHGLDQASLSQRRQPDPYPHFVRVL